MKSLIQGVKILFNSDNQMSVNLIVSVMSNVLNNFTDESSVTLATEIVANGLMNLKFPWYISIIQFIRRADDLTMARILFSTHNEFSREVIRDTITHLKYGNTQSEETNNSSFNQDELEKLIKILGPFAIEIRKKGGLIKEEKNESI
jgi:hypothetical protein